MKITGVKAVYPNYRHVVPSWRTHLWQIVVRIDTDAGITGYGYGGGGVAAVEVVNTHFWELLLGRTVDSVEDIAAAWDRLYAASLPYGRKGVAIMGLSGVDLALWDLLGRAENKPVYDLLGGRKKGRVPVYATGGDSEWYRETGFMHHKFPHRWTGKDSDYADAVASAAKARELFGPDAMIMIDTYMTWSTEATLEMARRLSDFNIYWFEDVLTPDDLAGQAALRQPVKPVLISGGEHEFTQYGFADIARIGALDPVAAGHYLVRRHHCGEANPGHCPRRVNPGRASPGRRNLGPALHRRHRLHGLGGEKSWQSGRGTR